MTKRIMDHPVLGKLEHNKTITFEFDGQQYEGYEQDTIASALLANGIRTLRKHEATGNPRGIYCNIGHCYECRCTVNNASNIRACLTPITDNMVIESGQVQPDPLNPNNAGPLPKTYQQFSQREAGNPDENE